MKAIFSLQYSAVGHHPTKHSTNFHACPRLKRWVEAREVEQTITAWLTHNGNMEHWLFSFTLY
jgi:hypothetical protein